MAEELGEKTELPSQRKRDETRQKGQVAKSSDLGAGIDLVGGFLLILFLGSFLMAGLGGMVRYVLDDRASGSMLNPGALNAILLWCSTHAAMLIAPFLAITFAVALLAQFFQVGWLFTLQPLQPKLDKLSPLAGIKRIVGPRNSMKTGVSIIKLIVVGSVAFAIISDEWERIALLSVLDVQVAFAAMFEILTRILTWLLALLLIIGIIDFSYQRWQQTQDLKMTKREVKDEHRSMDGDQEIKGRRLRLARQMALQRLKQSVPKADVIVTNPTHFSVALQYDPKTMAAPKVVAKGADLMAFRIREIAAAHRIPIVERPPLARALYAGVPVGKTISAEHFEAVAEILAYVYRLQNKTAA